VKEHLLPKIAIASAWKPEIETLHSMIPNSKEIVISDDEESLKCYHGKIHESDLVYFESGVGMTDSAISTSEILWNYPTIKYLIIAGVGGSLSSDNDISCVKVPEEWYDYSRQLFARSKEDGFQTPDHVGKFLHGNHFGFIYPYKTEPVPVSSFMMSVARECSENKQSKDNVSIGGHGLSASIFLDNPEYRDFLKTIHPDGVVVDMESYAVLRAGLRHIHKVGGIAIRTISDTAGMKGSGKNELKIEIRKATDQLALFLDNYLFFLCRKI
jgi:adenosylhomocysteine nucleosidase